MAEQNYSIERDLKEAQVMVEALVPYVYQDELYTLLGGNMPSLTLGAVLLRLRRLRALHGRMTAAQAEQFQQLEAKHEAIRKEWLTHYNKKLLREAEARLGNLLAYFKECEDEPQTCANAYLPEALRRTIIQEAVDELPDQEVQATGLREKVTKSDARLRRYVRPTDFIWDQVLKPAYPEKTYWWLYNRPPQPDDIEDNDEE
ncbi:MAG: hypothetical protein HZC41_04015 [Chloroflexi bacterium]|nr:hypothetical protein [Chloroflexota bacterium]